MAAVIEPALLRDAPALDEIGQGQAHDLSVLGPIDAAREDRAGIKVLEDGQDRAADAAVLPLH